MKKKLVALLMLGAMVASMTACGEQKVEDTAPVETDAVVDTEADADVAAGEADVEGEAEAEANTDTEVEADTEADVTVDEDAKSEGVMTYAEYAAADLDTEVTIEAYVQAKQSWWENQATVYTQDKDGAYFLYNMACSEDDYALLVPGTKIKVTGYKSEWSGEVEITDATFEIEEGSFVAEAIDVTDLLGTDELVEKQNQFVSFSNMTVESEALYKWDGSGSDGDDLYFDVSSNGETYTFTVESYLCDNTTEVYETVKNLQVGDVVNMEGFLYWYEGANPHITSVAVQ